MLLSQVAATRAEHATMQIIRINMLVQEGEKDLAMSVTSFHLWV